MRILAAVGCALIFAATAAPAKEPQEDQVVCKRQYDADTGSHFQISRKVCRKASEWKELEAQTERTLRSIKETGSPNPAGSTQGMGGAGPQ
jgi:hypothetical protein